MLPFHKKGQNVAYKNYGAPRLRDSVATQLEFISKTKYLPWEVGELNF